MEKATRSISVILMVSLLIISSALMIAVKIVDYSAENSEDNNSEVWQYTSAAKPQSEAKWSSFSNAEQIYENNIVNK